MKRKALFLSMAALFALLMLWTLAAGVSHAAAAAAPPVIVRSVLGGGGGPAVTDGTHFMLQGTLGEPVVNGPTTVSNVTHASGFWQNLLNQSRLFLPAVRKK